MSHANMPRLTKLEFQTINFVVEARATNSTTYHCRICNTSLFFDPQEPAPPRTKEKNLPIGRRLIVGVSDPTSILSIYSSSTEGYRSMYHA